MAMEKERCHLLAQFPDALNFFFVTPETYEEKGIRKSFYQPQADLILQTTAKMIASLDDTEMNKASLDSKLANMVMNLEIKYGIVGPIIRLAITGKTKTPGLAEIIEVLGKNETINRLEKARVFIKSLPPLPIDEAS